jgi:hypothetical protein
MKNALVIAAALCAACGSDPPPPDAPFPADYRALYSEVRNCRPSGDHDLNNIRVLADPAAQPVYMMRNAEFPAGAVVLKEEFDFGDNTCSGPVKQWTVMVRQASGSSPSTLDWHWYRVDTDRHITGDNVPSCIGCHTNCGVAPDGYQGTCAVP